MKISPEQARANIIAAYAKEHEAGVSALSSAIERVKGTKTDAKAKAEQAPKPTLADLLRESAQAAS
jgi:hypothetical protein